MMQNDACGYHGSSGGPLLDLQGRVLGVNSYPGLQGYDVPGLTLAIPSNTIQKIVPKLISQHSYNGPQFAHAILTTKELLSLLPAEQR